MDLAHEVRLIPVIEPRETIRERNRARRERKRKPYDERWHGHAWRKPGEPEKYPCPTDKFWWQYDTDVLEVARLLVGWLSRGDLKRPIYRSSLWRAQQLLKVYTWLDPADQKLKWKLRKNWQNRLLACGVDPNTFRIKNLNRWTRAWEYMKCEYRCPVELIEQEILDGKPAPEYKPFTWSQSLRAQFNQHWNEYGPMPQIGQELIARSWFAQIRQELGPVGAQLAMRQRRLERYYERERKASERVGIPLYEDPEDSPE